jgi:hypothetical protein
MRQINGFGRPFSQAMKEPWSEKTQALLTWLHTTNIIRVSRTHEKNGDRIFRNDRARSKITASELVPILRQALQDKAKAIADAAIAPWAKERPHLFFWNKLFSQWALVIAVLVHLGATAPDRRPLVHTAA